MAKETVSIELLIENAGGAKSIGELKKSIRDLKSEALNVKEGSKEFVQLTAAAAQAKNKMDDLGEAIGALNPEGRGAAFAKFGATLASGFQAAQGAAALFGQEGKDLEKTMLKVQAATAFAQGIQGVTDLKKQFQLLGTVLKANPILLIGTVVAALGVALFALKDKVKIIGDAFEVVGGIVEKVKNVFFDFTDSIGLTNTAADKEAAKLEKTFARLIARGKEMDEDKIKRAEFLKEEAEKQKKYQTDFDADIAKRTKAFEEEGARARKAAEEKEEKDKKAKEEKDAKEKAIDDKMMARLGVNLNVIKTNQEGEREQYKKTLETQRAIENAKYSLAQSSLSGLTSLGQLFINDQQKLEKFNKASALVQIGIDTATAISKALSVSQSPTPDNVATGGLAGIAKYGVLVATILANAAKAKQILSGSGSSGAVSLGGAGGGSGTPQLNPQTGRQGTNESFINQQTGEVEGFKVYVTETDITERQKRIAKIRGLAVIE